VWVGHSCATPLTLPCSSGAGALSREPALNGSYQGTHHSKMMSSRTGCPSPGELALSEAEGVGTLISTSPLPWLLE